MFRPFLIFIIHNPIIISGKCDPLTSMLPLLEASEAFQGRKLICKQGENSSDLVLEDYGYHWRYPEWDCTFTLTAEIWRDFNTLIDISETSTVLAMNDIVTYGSLLKEFKHVIKFNENNIERLASLLPPFDSKVYLAETSPNCSLHIYEAYSLNNHLHVNLVEIRHKNGSLISSKGSIWERRRDLRGTEIRVVMNVSLTEPYLGYNSLFASEIIKKLSSRMNFTVIPVQPDLNQSYDEAIKHLGEESADVFAVISLSDSEERRKQAEFTQSLTFTYIHFYVKVDSETKADLFAMMTVELWSAITIAVGCIAASLVFLGKTNHCKLFSKLDIMSLIICQGITSYKHLKGSAKILILTTALFGIFLYNLFSARLASSISVKSLTPPIENLHMIVDKNLKAFITSGGATETFFKTAPEGSTANKIWEQVTSYFEPSSLLLNPFFSVLHK